jgi:hypothetical protein
MLLEHKDNFTLNVYFLMGSKEDAAIVKEKGVDSRPIFQWK